MAKYIDVENCFSMRRTLGNTHGTPLAEDVFSIERTGGFLGGGFKYFLFSPLFGEDFPFDEHIFQMGGSTTNQIPVSQLFNKFHDQHQRL